MQTDFNKIYILQLDQMELGIDGVVLSHWPQVFLEILKQSFYMNWIWNYASEASYQGKSEAQR